jgi:hypothetical protein
MEASFSTTINLNSRSYLSPVGRTRPENPKRSPEKAEKTERPKTLQGVKNGILWARHPIRQRVRPENPKIRPLQQKRTLCLLCLLWRVRGILWRTHPHLKLIYYRKLKQSHSASTRRVRAHPRHQPQSRNCNLNLSHPRKLNLSS